MIVLKTNTENLNTFHQVLTEISVFKNIMVKIKISDIFFDIFLSFLYA